MEFATVPHVQAADKRLARANGGSQRRGWLREYRHYGWQFQAKRRAAFRPIEAEDAAAVLLHHAVTDTEA
jgi:hypothetical protein